MQKIDRSRFLFAFQGPFGALKDAQKAGLSFLLESLEADDQVTDLRHAAYMLATVYHECAGTWQPIAENDHGAGHPYGLPDSRTGQVYYGRGYVQLTWYDNYREMGRVFGLDLCAEPALVLHPDVAYKIMSYGMRKGAFTGARLSTFLHDDVTDYLHARKIINGTDCAERIADYAQKIEICLEAATQA
jgi:predicted chitinase